MKIFCVGRNYSEHAKELNNEIPEAPVIFMKPPTAILKGKDFYIPEFSSDVHYECELVFRVCKNGKHIEPQFASKYIAAMAFTPKSCLANASSLLQLFLSSSAITAY